MSGMDVMMVMRSLAESWSDQRESTISSNSSVGKESDAIVQQDVRTRFIKWQVRHYDHSIEVKTPKMRTYQSGACRLRLSIAALLDLPHNGSP